MAIRRLVLDVLKPIKGISIVELAEKIVEHKGIEGVNISVTDMDVETMGLMIVVEGENIDFENVKNTLEEEGCAIHSIDEVVSGSKMVDSRRGRNDM
ncbi:DUF211 domain-containing protein [Sulfuracidifex metallicus]|uniref:DUF211 domain-containing protein n=1 Tax=Sulfuracidifex metallicus DSM 6482 = JCM 9184 TaxID=523847 RepID=A0A6A9QQP3_SULME|nr:DUF211 domain-containing protein [Sulfuracidifex metallicus]MCY0849952.1 DUF211 domain-containing protein [Sulfuracidifex metallicus]MUN28133.1 hypothetical protein [Sulfuracidifex metallicus DSM 6482 = JCM 9184]WOE51326.1 DUF211 domain-containing protein [Sulfuracidifex metallicus DSM 6482 = JCM 9184]